MWLKNGGILFAVQVLEMLACSNAKDLPASDAAHQTKMEQRTVLRRPKRAVKALEMPSLDWTPPLSTTTMVAPYSGSYADQLFFEGQGPPMPSAPLERQVPVPPPPLAVTQTPVPSPASINSVLQALLPLLALSSFGGGSEEGGHGSSLLLPFLLSSLGGGGGGFAGGGGVGGGEGLLPGYAPGLARSFGAFPYGVPPFLLRSGKGHSPKRMLAQRAVSEHGSQIALLKCSPVPRPKVCDDMPFDKILSIGDAILAIKGQNVYRFDTDGNPVDDQPFELDSALRGLSAAVNIRGSDYLFQGDRYHKYRNGLKPGLSTIEFRRVKSGFPGLMSPIDGVFQLNNHTFIAVSGSKFQAFYPDEKLPVKSKDEVRSVNEISGAPGTVDSVFFMNNRTILHKNEMLYEMEPGKLQVAAMYPLKSPIEGEGWIHCPEERLAEATDCTVSLNDVPSPSQNIKARNNP